MKIDVRNECDDFRSYRAARVKSMFNVESGAHVDIHADLLIDGPDWPDGDWKLGVIVGPSGSGKSTIGHRLFGGGKVYEPHWPDNEPIVDAVAPDGEFDEVTAALASVGLGDVPSWLRPYRVLSNGERFRADLARVLAEAPESVVIDEFSSVVDRQIAKVGAGAFAKAWKRTAGKAVLLTCHYDVLEWLEPDWVYDTGAAEFEVTRGSLHRPSIEVAVRKAPRSVWPYFEPHHYLRADAMPFSLSYIAEVDGEAVAHVGVSSKSVGKGMVEARACRLVVLPEWQGAGVGVRFLNAVCDMYRRGEGHLPASTVQFHTSHPGLCAALRRDRRWSQLSGSLYGSHKGKSAASIAKAAAKRGSAGGGGFGGHFRAVQGFRYHGDEAAA